MEEYKLPDRLPAFNYYIDESDPDILLLRLQDGALVAAFSASGATTEGIIEASKEDHWRHVSAYLARQSQGIEGQRSDQIA
jgi:hypothetical protein